MKGVLQPTHLRLCVVALPLCVVVVATACGCQALVGKRRCCMSCVAPGLWHSSMCSCAFMACTLTLCHVLGHISFPRCG